MLFNSFSFAAFFFCVVVVRYLPIPWTLRKANLLIASYLFYAAWTLWFPLLLALVTLANGLAASLMAKWDEFPRRRRTVIWLNVALNIGMLCVFKYGGDLLAAWRWGASQFGFIYQDTSNLILLPVGLSFFTFQALSYSIDVYRRTIRPATSALDLALFVAFFPVLLAGPLLRAGDFIPQCRASRPMRIEQFGCGAALITLGLFMKVTLADQFFAPIARMVYETSVHPDCVSAWIGTIAFAGQDYCDFAGYSTCAMGIGLCIGFNLPENFRAPFASVGFRDLWQRWHITLVAWMRDYVFNSLGGVYGGYRRAALNVMIVMVLIGLWHGAAWTYVIFGLLHGCYLIVETSVQRWSIRRLRFWSGRCGTFLLWLVTMLLCLVAFTFYRANSLAQSWTILSAMCGFDIGFDLHLDEYALLTTILVAELLIVAHWLCRNVRVVELPTQIPWWLLAIGLALMLLAITLSSAEQQDFLYFTY